MMTTDNTYPNGSSPAPVPTPEPSTPPYGVLNPNPVPFRKDEKQPRKAEHDAYIESQAHKSDTQLGDELQTLHTIEEDTARTIAALKNYRSAIGVPQDETPEQRVEREKALRDARKPQKRDSNERPKVVPVKPVPDQTVTVTVPAPRVPSAVPPEQAPFRPATVPAPAKPEPFEPTAVPVRPGAPVSDHFKQD